MTMIMIMMMIDNDDNNNNNNNNNNNKKKKKKKKKISTFIPMINIIIIKFYYLQIQEYEILKYIPYVHSSSVRKRIVVK